MGRSKKRRKKNNQLQKDQQHSYLKNTERAARIAAMLTIVAGLFFLFAKILSLLITIFSTKVYLTFPFRLEHTVIASVFTLLMLTIFHVIYQIYRDAYTYNSYFGTKYNTLEKSAINADKSYYMMFKALKHYFYALSICNLTFFIVIQIYFRNVVIIGLMIAFCLFCLLLTCKNWKGVKRYLFAFKSNSNYYLRASFILFCTFIFSVAFTEQSKLLLFQFNYVENKNLNLVIQGENFSPTDVQIEYYYKDKNDDLIRNVKVTLDVNDFRYAFIENTQETITDDESLTKQLDQQFKKNSSAALLSKSTSKYIYQATINEHLMVGENFVVITMEVPGYGINDNIKIVNQVYEDERGTITITQEEFKWSFK